MIAELGHFALVAAFALAIAQILAGLAVARENSRSGRPALDVRSAASGLVVGLGPEALARRLSYAQLIAVALSFGLLIWAFLHSDFSVLLVTEHSHSDKPWIFKFSGTWGNHEGSILMWLLILALFGAWAAAALARADVPQSTRVWALVSQAALSAMFAAFIIWTSNPFERLFPVPLDGGDLNPLLQDIGLALHPPLLYMGYVGFSVVFAFAVGGLVSGQIDRAWAALVRPFALAAWAFLTGGIALGSWWASYELGWGGWWFWDPVENLSLMPWLTGTALIHSLLVLAKRDSLRSWTVFLALVTFAASLLGTFAVRSGILTSVHSFAVDPARGSVILGIFVLSVGAAFTLFAVRAPSLPPGGKYGLETRENAIVLNNLLLCSATAAVFVGTFYPIIAEMLDQGRPSVGAPFYAATFNPMMLMLLTLMALGPMLAWRTATPLGRVFLRGGSWLVVGALVTSVSAGLIAWRFGPLALAVIAVAGSMAAGALWSLARDARGAGWVVRLSLSHWAMPLAHLGLAIAVVGMVGGSVWVREHLVALSPGESQTLPGTDWQVAMQGLVVTEHSNYRATSAPLVLTRGQTQLALAPERRQYAVRAEATTELDTARSLAVNLGLTDVFATLGPPTETGRVVVKIVFRPFQVLLWLGALVMVVGGLLPVLDPARRRAATPDVHPRAGSLASP